jgi:V-type H+-transporting ATPase subunit C
MLLYPHKKNTKRLRDVLNQLYGHLDSSVVQESGAHDVRIACNNMVIEWA